MGGEAEISSKMSNELNAENVNKHFEIQSIFFRHFFFFSISICTQLNFLIISKQSNNK